ncbi:phosphoribosylformylglycinamidine synthase subunit PurL [Bythopirellula polymerisocia]|uniref:Phosphoribosylformylglycinamidine synthase subunit PurL n=1 Tax=Bythopirellula polymerisocia TaxID=2528003 RepID=A0A5C6CQD7_9BACT|nr:phosphoribosylformylglycinamidine synthase subunit PurL [Bythopirellula polymerisocia]TWU25724.1 Phosphoribosylformylglycinamidine synthase subunit PurL [Bythopirellula polymerisocia]
MLWEFDIHPLDGLPDQEAQRIALLANETGICPNLSVRSARGFLLESDSLNADQANRLAEELFADNTVESSVVAPVGDSRLVDHASSQTKGNCPTLLQVLLKPGVMDPVAQSAETAIRDFGYSVSAVRTLRKYWIDGASEEQVAAISERILANDAIEQTVQGPLGFDELQQGCEYQFKLLTVPLGGLDDEGLMRLSREGQLYLQLAEMQTIQRHFAELGREPTDIELETLAQTWSEHCSHKTLAGRIAYRDERGARQFENMLKETIFAATTELRSRWGNKDWCVSVFRDNAGIVRFNDEFNVAFKVETHNHPSALEPYGGANTGIGGVIRDTIGTGMGAKPVCNTDVFCFAPPDTLVDDLPSGVLNPKRVMRGVVSGVRDYGNRMGIPTVNGAVFFDSRYLGNPLVYCGNVGIIPVDKSFKQPQPNDLIVSVGGRTGRDGIHGATFSSAELTQESESLSGGAVQIGNAVEEKKVLDVLLAIRDRGLYTAITDCGAGGFSSAVGEMGEEIGAEVWLELAPVKYAGLTYTEIWISEAQERMVLSVPEPNWEELHALCAAEGVEATVIGKFAPTGRLVLKYDDEIVGDLAMDLLHNGRPPVIRSASFTPAEIIPLEIPTSGSELTADLCRILGSYNVASKEWIIRQYDHEVQGGSVVKPLVGVNLDGPSDAAVVRPVLSSRRGLVISCGMNPRYGDLDTYHMAASAIDEAIRNCVAVGADPARIALLDNFCWGDCEKSETLGSLVRAALACHDLSLEFETPFISGKDSLNNEFSFVGSDGKKQTIAIPPTLLISALGQIADVASAVTMDLKHSDSLLYLVGETKNELGGSHFALIHELEGGQVPTVDPAIAKQTFAALHQAIVQGLVASCHDLSEGGLAVAAAEMCFAGGIGAELELAKVPKGSIDLTSLEKLFSESNTRFLCEVQSKKASEFENLLAGVPLACLGHTMSEKELRISEASGSAPVISAKLTDLKTAWKEPLAW